MAVHKTERRGKKGTRKSAQEQSSAGRSRWLSALVGGLLIVAALAWFSWLIIGQHNPNLTFRLPYINPPSQPTEQPTADPLLASGITLATPSQGQTAALTQQQARLLADQLEPLAAVHAGKVDTAYVLFSYKGSKTIAEIHDVPAWLIHYMSISLTGPDRAADPHATAISHDCYLFLNAENGQELLALWV